MLIVTGFDLVVAFFWGVVFNQFKRTIPYSNSLFFLSILAMSVCFASPQLRNLGALPATYFTISLGLKNPARSSILLSGDYSYGLYLYGYPIQQAIASLGPKFHYTLVNFLIAYPLTFAFAIFSWWSLEKRALTLRTYVDPKRLRAAISAVTSPMSPLLGIASQSLPGAERSRTLQPEPLRYDAIRPSGRLGAVDAGEILPTAVATYPRDISPDAT